MSSQISVEIQTPPSGMTVTCQHVEYSSSSARQIHQWSRELLRASSNDSANDVLVTTCQHAAWVSIGTRLTPSADFGPSRSGIISDWGEVLMYLAELAAGVNARVLGDRYAYIQVEKAFTARSLSPPLLALGAAALQIAKDARDRYSFWTTEYPRITYRLLQSVSMKESTLPRLVLVGGGMLAQSLLASVNAAHYRSIYVITRNPERLSYTLEDKQYSILSPRNLSQLNWLDGTFQCLIATEGIDDPYRAGLASLVEKPGCEVTMDLSTIPVFLGTPPTSTLYLTIYDSNVQQELEFVNSTLTETARTVARDIARATWTLLPAHAPRLPRDPSLYSLSTWT